MTASVNAMLDLLQQVRRKGVRLWSQQGRLHYEAPKGALTHDDLVRLKESSVQIVEFLDRASGGTASEPRLIPRARRDRAPLTYTQLAHWRAYKLGERPAIRHVASATRLRGKLDLEAFQASVTELVRRHEALRTRIIVEDGVLMQAIDEPFEFELSVVDLAGLSEEEREKETARLIEDLIVEPIDIAVGPLFGLQLIRLRETEHVLVVALEHLISDGFSQSLISRDLFTSYAQTVRGVPTSLPAISLQFSDYAVWQASNRESWLSVHGPYIRARFAGCDRTRFPEPKAVSLVDSTGWGVVPFQIDNVLKAELTEWAKAHRTTLVMAVLTAYAGVLMRWCNVNETVVQFQSDNRNNSEIENTVGYFASPLSLRVELRNDDTFDDLLGRVTAEYYKAIEHADYGYLESQDPRPEFAQNSLFNWLPLGPEADCPPAGTSDDAIELSPVSFDHPILERLDRDLEPTAGFVETKEGISGTVLYRKAPLSEATIECFVKNFVMCLEELLIESAAELPTVRFQAPLVRSD